MPMSRDYRAISLWHETVPGPLKPRARLRADRQADVAIVGAGFTGLWTAYYLQQANPDLDIVLVDAEIAGFGASGRNGGWCSALFPVGPAALAREHGVDGARAQYRAMRESIVEVARVAAAEAIDADIATGGTVVLARTPVQLERSSADVRESDEYELGLQLLDETAARDRLAATDVLGATYTPHCAAIHPAKLVRGLADVVEARGAHLFEQSRARTIEPHAIATDSARISAEVVVRATEGYTAALPGLRRAIVPVYSLIIATEPLPDSTWAEIGLRERETFSDHRHLIVYGQRTADGRMVFGGRGAPYHLGSAVRPSFDRVPAVFAALRRTLVELFPVLAAAKVTHAWGGPLGIARDWHASVGFDGRGAWAGGYVGDGVSTSNLAGRTLADLIGGRTSPLTELPWVGHRSPQWEPEPLRWLGANAGLWAMRWADSAEQRRGRPSRTAAIVDRVLGR
jgi:glycine/D-amino acid oxidase-like deaminating enzyme